MFNNLFQTNEEQLVVEEAGVNDNRMSPMMNVHVVSVSV